MEEWVECEKGRTETGYMDQVEIEQELLKLRDSFLP